MNVPSFTALGFAIVGAIVFNVSASLAWRRCVLLVLNLAFFANFRPKRDFSVALCSVSRDRFCGHAVDWAIPLDRHVVDGRRSRAAAVLLAQTLLICSARHISALSVCRNRTLVRVLQGLAPRHRGTQ